MLLKIVIVVGWMVFVRFLCLSVNQKNGMITDFLNIMAEIRFGVCERHMGLNDIYEQDHEELFHEVRQSGLYQYTLQNQEELGLSDMTMQKLRLFEEQTAIASFAACEAQMFELSEAVSSELKENQTQLKKQSIGRLTMVTAVFLIIIILLI
ncbi:MAG: hypothetical protein HFE78_03865 [Clostridiales bacterium]|nr:hypothetical protein [Clostridiales bacterium]